MPRFDGTGPAGAGPATGWGRGPCGAGMGRGAGMGAGRGFGRRRFWGSYPGVALEPKQEKGILEDEVAILEEELKATKKRLAGLKGQK